MLELELIIFNHNVKIVLPNGNLRIYINFTPKYSIAAYASTCRCGPKGSDFCLRERYIIARANQKKLFNKRTELISNIK